MVSSIQNVSFQGNYAPTNKVKVKPTIKNKATEILAKNETVNKAVRPQKSKKKKVLTTIALTLGTIAGLAIIGNRSSNFMATLGQKVDDKLLNQKWYQSLEKGLGNCKQKISDFLFKNNKKIIKETAEDITATFKNRHAKPTLDIARGYGRGFTSIFSLTPVDILRKSLNKIEQKNPGQAIKSLEKLIGPEKASEYFDKLVNNGNIADNKKFCEEITELIAKNFGAKDATGKTNTKKLLQIFKDLQKGKVQNVDFSEFTQVKMQEKGFGGITSGWWPVNIIDSAGSKISKIFGKEWKNIGRGNLGDSLIKFNAVNGSLAKTKVGSLVQQCVTIPTESISNFVNDKSGMGVLLGLTVASLYNNVQEAPKEKRRATIANDYLSTIGSIAITTPLAFQTTYALASLKNLEGKTGITKALKIPGKIFGLGHKQIGLDGKFIENASKNKFLESLGRTGGHALRFILIMMVFNSLFGKPINKCIQKVFGKPYDAAEEERKKEKELAAQQQMQANNPYIQALNSNDYPAINNANLQNAV